MSSLPPRPKPWETSTGTSAPPAGSSATSGPSAFDTAVATSSSAAPALPDRPGNLDAAAAGSTGYAGAYGGSGAMQPYASRFGGGYAGGSMGGYSSLGGLGGMGYSSYGSPYSRMGGGYGGYGAGGYGGYGGYGAGGYGVGGMGGPGEAYNLSSSLQQSTAPAFAVLESLVTAFTSLAQLVESTYMATHSSFFAMVGVADQLGSLKTYLGQVLGVFSVLRLGKRILNWLRGRKSKTEGWVNEWAGVAGPIGPPAGLHGGSNPKDPSRPSAKPLVLFLLSAVGLPWLMSRLIRLLIAHTQRQQQQQVAALDANGTLDPSKLVFARAKWEFRAGEEWELSLGRDEIVAVLEMRDQGKDGQASGWWRGRTRDGKIGWFPGNYVEIIKRRDTPAS